LNGTQKGIHTKVKHFSFQLVLIQTVGILFFVIFGTGNYGLMDFLLWIQDTGIIE